ncbi:MAG TPA: phenylacetate--CoA ligase, partial [Candidatus Atribacteria bacterium]|nr:phenylacetate--CoA ligase [Candidatus Atribacteria bacterium]
LHYGAEKLGATVVPASAGNTLRQIQIMKDLKITVLTCTPSYALYLSEVAQENNISWKESSLRIGVFGAEPWSEEMREDIEKKLPIRAFDIYGLSEVVGPGVAFECEEKEGLHISEDHFLPEIVDPQTGRVLPPGEEGELVFTTLTKEGTPLIRYRTGDISSLNYEPCSCGRTLVRMKRVFSRTDDMLIVRGVNVYPSQIESIILSFDGVEPYYQIVLTRESFLDQIEVQVEVTPQFFSDQIKVLEGLKKQIEEKLKTELNLSCEVKLLEPKSITRSEGKSKRVIDLRKKEEIS